MWWPEQLEIVEHPVDAFLTIKYWLQLGQALADSNQTSPWRSKGTYTFTQPLWAELLYYIIECLEHSSCKCKLKFYLTSVKRLIIIKKQ